MALKEHNFHLFLSLRRLSFPISKCIPSYLAAAKDQKVFMDPPFFPPLNCPSPLLFSYISVYVWVIPFISWQGFYLSLISNPPPRATQSSPIQDQLLHLLWMDTDPTRYSSTSSVSQIKFSSPDENTFQTCSQRMGNTLMTQLTLTVLSAIWAGEDLQRWQFWRPSGHRRVGSPNQEHICCLIPSSLFQLTNAFEVRRYVTL